MKTMLSMPSTISIAVSVARESRPSADRNALIVGIMSDRPAQPQTGVHPPGAAGAACYHPEP